MGAISVSQILDALLPGVRTTLELTFVSFGLGLILAAGVTRARLGHSRVIRGVARAYIDLVRGVPPIVWLFIVFFGVGQGAFRMSAMVAAILGLGVIASAYLAEIYRAGIASVPSGQWDAAASIGLRPTGRFVLVILRQAVPLMIPAAATYLIGLLKDTALASTVGVAEVTFRAYQLVQNNLAGLEIFALTAVIYIAMSVPLGILARWINRTLGAHLHEGA